MDHKPSLQSEVKRLEALQCFVINEKVGGVLAVSRAFGDAEFKPFVCATPYLLETVVTPQDGFIILACDGVKSLHLSQFFFSALGCLHRSRSR
jgi:serine/threonine protein phosphatase PrpC